MGERCLDIYISLLKPKQFVQACSFNHQAANHQVNPFSRIEPKLGATKQTIGNNNPHPENPPKDEQIVWTPFLSQSLDYVKWAFTWRGITHQNGLVE